MGKEPVHRRCKRPFHSPEPHLLILLLLAVLFAGPGGVMPAAAAIDLAPDLRSAWFVDNNLMAASAHTAFSCEECHGDMREGGRLHPDSTAADFLKDRAVARYDYARCKRCHLLAYERTFAGKHAEALQREAANPEAVPDPRKRAPRCGDCHSAHYEPSHRTRLQIGRAMTPVCGSCHPAQMATYLEDQHGRNAVYLGDEKSAFCTDCHGAHTCLSLKEAEAAVKACRRCHPDAGQSFAQVVIHRTVQDLDQGEKDKRARVAVIRAVTAIMTVLVLLVVVFFYGHSFLWLLRELHERLRKRGS